MTVTVAAIIATPCITAFGGLVGGLVLAWIKEEYLPSSYKDRRSNLLELKSELRKLRKKFRRLQNMAVSAEQGTPILTSQAQVWMAKAATLLDNVDIQSLQRSIEARFVTTFLPDCRHRWNASCLIEEEAQNVDNLTAEYEQLVLNPVVRGYRQCPDEIVMETRKEDIEKIWGCLTRRDVKVIWIYGIAGVGKTEVAKVILSKALDDKTETFSHVIWVDAEYGTKSNIVQKQIVKSACSALCTTKDVGHKETTVYDELVKRKKCLLILDSFREEFSLQDIIAIPQGINCQEIDCMVIVISRLPPLHLQELMCFEIKPLCPVKSRKVFDRAFGNSLLDMRTKLQAMEEEVLEDCGGLPLLIKILGQHLKRMDGKSLDEINCALKEILNGGVISLLNDKQFKGLKYSYERLDKIDQVCFLYCALYPKGWPIEARRLIEYWIGEGLFDEWHMESLEERRAKGMEMLKKLEDAHLVEVVTGNNGEKLVKMIGLFHDMGVNIIHKQSAGFCRNQRKELNSFPDINDQCRKLQRAAFVHNNVTRANRAPNLPVLLTLLLRNNPLSGFCSGFFSNIPNLKVLDLSYTSIIDLPIADLQHLQILLLHGCSNLKYLPSFLKLEKLIVLDLFGTAIEYLPTGLEKSKNLRRLDVSYTKLTKFPASMLEELRKLQELLITMDDVEAYSWRSELMMSSSEEADVEQLARVEDLTVLHLNFYNMQAFKQYISSIASPNLPSFKFCIGGVCKNRSLGENSIVVVGDYDDLDQLPEGTLELYLTMSHRSLRTIETPNVNFQSLKVLDVSYCTGLIYLFSVEMLHCLQSLKKISVRQCWSLLGLIQPDPQSILSCSFPHLKELVLIELPSLESIDSEQQVNLEWPAFSTLSVWHCENLKMLPRIVDQDGNAKNFTVRSKKVTGKKASVMSLNLDNTQLANLVFEAAQKPEDMVFVEWPQTPESEPTSATKSKDDQAIFFERRASQKPGPGAILAKNDGIQNSPERPGFIERQVNAAAVFLKKMQPFM